MALKIGILGGKGHYGRLLRHLIRRFTDDVEVLVSDCDASSNDSSYVEIEELADCDAVIFAVPMDAFEDAVRELLMVPGLREDMVFVNVCSDQRKSGAALAELAGHHPYICVHSPWGPEAYRNVGEDVRKLPPIILTQSNVDEATHRYLMHFVQSKGFQLAGLSADRHDTEISANRMYLAHLVSQIMQRMGRLKDDPYDHMAPLSFQDIKRGAQAVGSDLQIFLDLWHRVPECEQTFDEFIAAALALKSKKDAYVSAK
ncbi:MAG TPA: hypothetical protein VJB97_03605 [Candidatus Paceibacterota bacterium]